jgi:hypothetical protein
MRPRLRAGWRLVIQMTILGWLLLLEIFAFAFARSFYHWQVSDTGLFILGILFQLIAFTLSVYMARRFLDRRSFLDLGLRMDEDTATEIFLGVITAAGLWMLVFFGMAALHWLDWQRASSSWFQVVLYFLLFCVVGFQEELLCRGYILKTITGGWNVFWGMLISSAIFAALHLGNPGVSWMAMLGIFCAGMLLAFAAVRTGKLWLSIGLHTGWNFFEAVVFGFTTSGVVIPALMKIHLTGPLLWTGGAFGPEAGLIILPALAVGAGLVWAFTR